MNLPLSARVYLWATALGAAGFLFHCIQLSFWPAPTNLALMLELVTLAVAAMHFPLTLGPRYKTNVAIAIHFACILLFGVPVAMALVGLSQLVGGLSLGLRRSESSGIGLRNPFSIVFNTSQMMTATGLGGLVYYAIIPVAIPAPLDRVENLWALPTAAATVYLANSTAVAVMVGLQLRQDPVEVWLRGRIRNTVHVAALFLIGVLIARTTAQDLLMPLVMVIPMALVYLSLKMPSELFQHATAVVEAMADAVDRRQRYNVGHSRRVAEYATLIARELDLPIEDIENIRLAARAHDIGKMAVPDEVLLKPRGLTLEEWEIMARHVLAAADILQGFPQYHACRELVLTYCERFDGKGYPRGLEGDQVPIGAQVVSLADSLDAMMSDRPYRSALRLEQALTEIRHLKGIQWHPRVVEALESLLGKDPNWVTSAAAGTVPEVEVAAVQPGS